MSSTMCSVVLDIFSDYYCYAKNRVIINKVISVDFNFFVAIKMTFLNEAHMKFDYDGAHLSVLFDDCYLLKYAH